MLSSLLSKAMTFFLLPVYTQYFTTTEYGILNSLNSIGELVTLAISLYLDSAFGRFYHEVSNDRDKLRELVSTVYFFILLWGITAVGLIIFSSLFWAPGLLKVPIWPYVVIAFVPLIFAQLGNIGLIYLRQKLKVKAVTGLTLFYNLAGIACTLILIIDFGMDIKARLIGNAIAGFILFLIVTGIYVSQGLLAIRINLHRLKDLLFYSIPLLPAIAGSWIASLSDRIIIARYDSLASTGLYSFAFQIAKVTYLVQDSITKVAGPVSMSGMIHDKEATVKKILKLSKVLFIFLLCFCFGQFLLSKEIILAVLLLGKGDTAYLDSAVLISIIATMYVFSAQYRLFLTIPAYHKKTWVSSSGAILMAVLNLSLNLVFVPKFGRNAAAFTSVFAIIFYALWIVFWSIRLEKLRINYGFYILLFGIYIALTAGIYFLYPEILEFTWMNFIIKGGILLSAMPLIWLIIKRVWQMES